MVILEPVLRHGLHYPVSWEHPAENCCAELGLFELYSTHPTLAVGRGISHILLPHLGWRQLQSCGCEVHRRRTRETYAGSCGHLTTRKLWEFRFVVIDLDKPKQRADWGQPAKRQPDGDSEFFNYFVAHLYTFRDTISKRGYHYWECPWRPGIFGCGWYRSLVISP